MSCCSTPTPRRILRTATLGIVLAGVFTFAARISGQSPVQSVSPFDIIGFIQKATLDTPGDVLSGGSMTVNGHVIIVPRNTILQMPAAALTWQEVFALAPAVWRSAGVSGLAMQDRGTTGTRPLATYEVHVQGNRIVDPSGDRYIAGLVFISQQSLNVGQGYVNYIDYAKGEMRVGGIQNDPTTGARVRINDPFAKFSKGDALDASHQVGTRSPDERFTIDEDNPTIRTETGYPMCLPRQLPDDQYCPQRNRPQTAPPAFDQVIGGNPFWFEPGGNSGQVVTKTDYSTYTAPLLGGIADSMLPAPFEVGDYVAYSGMLVYDGAASGAPVTPTTAMPASGPPKAGDTYVSAHSIVASLGFFTHPGTSPVYVAIDVMLMGTGGLNTATAPQEATLRTRVEGFSTDPFGASFSGAIVRLGGGGGKGGGGGTILAGGSAINIAAIDVACDGTVTDRLWAYGVASDPGVVFGGAVAGRWRFRPTGGSYLPPARNLRASMADMRGQQGFRLVTQNLPPKPGDSTGTPQGLETGQYNAPIFTFIFPENLVIGGPTIGNNFGDFPFLANGSGPYTGPGGQAIVGQLAPWPGVPAPSSACGASAGGGTPVLLNAPDVLATASKALANSGDAVTLSATITDLNQPPQAITSITWTAPAGVTLAPNNASATVTFTAPNVTAPTALAFRVTATNAAGLSSSAPVSVAVNPAPVVQPGAPSLAITATVGAVATSPGSGTALVLPWSVNYASFGVQLVAKSTAVTKSNGVTISWVMPAAQPNSTVLSFTGPSSSTDKTTRETTSWATFNASWTNTLTNGAGLVAGSAPAVYTFKVSARDNKTGATQTQTVTVTVVPPPDVLTAAVTYTLGLTGGGKTTKLQVTAASNVPTSYDPNTLEVLSPRFTLTLVVSDPFDPRFGQVVVWNSWAMILGTPTATVLGFPMPDSITVTSSAGGSVTVFSSNFTVR